MVKKFTIAYFLFLMIVCYVISPTFFERYFFFNELLSIAGILLLIRNKYKIRSDYISVCIYILLLLNIIHCFFSIFRMDRIYYYFRNLVIFYSVFTYFIGYYLYKYFNRFLNSIRNLLSLYISIFLVIPVFSLFERFGMATIFPFLFKKISNKLLLPIIIIINIIYSVTYSSLTALVISFFYCILLIIPSYQFFKQLSIIGIVVFLSFFFYIIPNLNLISENTHSNNSNIQLVMNSNPILKIDGNSTWRLVLWKQIIIDHFPANIFGIGFGTPMFKYFPIEDYKKVTSLPYILGGHNSFIYLFGRLGLLYIILTFAIYRFVFREYFYFKKYHYLNKTIIYFWSFFAISIIAAFNPSLESPIYSGLYWFILGLLASVIIERNVNYNKIISN
jgi:hypothetical protein